jgi:hypothetical protein
MKNGISYSDIKQMSDKEIFEFVTIISEVSEMEKDAIDQMQTGAM